MRLPFGVGSLLGAIRAAPGLVGGDHLARLGVTLHAFIPGRSTGPSGAR
jgi:hypothetical protein